MKKDNLTKITTLKGFEIRRSYNADDRLVEELQQDMFLIFGMKETES